MRLTEDLLRGRKRPTSGQQFEWDDLVAGFGVRFTRTATAFVIQWRNPDGSKPRETLRPRWPSLSVQAAREAARRRLGEVVAIAGTAASQRLRDAMRAWFDRKTETAGWRPRYRTKVDSLLRHYVESEETVRVRLRPTVRKAVEDLGNKPVASVSRSDVMRVADGLKRGSAEQFMAIGSSFYNDMFDRGVEVVNPFRNRLRVTGGRRVRSRTLTDAEFCKLWGVLKKEGDPALGAFAMLAFTAARRREVTQMAWAEVDLEAASWTLPPERRKTGRKDPHPFVVYLHRSAVETLRRQPRLEGSPFVFWGRRDERPFDFHYALMQRLRTAGIAD
ncbi:MAG TPA: hypothetical protein VGL55_11625, partial [Steroidobacteraceae bacterium]